MMYYPDSYVYVYVLLEGWPIQWGQCAWSRSGSLGAGWEGIILIRNTKKQD